MYYLNPYAVPHFVALLANLSLGLYVFSKNPKAKVNRLFALSMLSLSTFALGQFMLHISADPETALFWAKVKFAGGILFWSALLPHFVLVFIGKEYFFGKKIYYFYFVGQ
jgi:hypothetical protein